MSKKIMSYIILIFLTAFLTSCDFFGNNNTTTTPQEQTTTTAFDPSTTSEPTVTVSTTTSETTTISTTTRTSNTTTNIETTDQTTTEPVQFTVTFYESNDLEPYSTVTVNSGDTITFPTIVKEYLLLIGWFSNPDYSGDAFNETTPIYQDLDLYAFWELDLYQLLTNEYSDIFIIPDDVLMPTGLLRINELETDLFGDALVAMGCDHMNLLDGTFMFEISQLIDHIDVILASDIMHASISKVLLDFLEQEYSFFHIPYASVDGTDIRYFNSEIELISKIELSHFFSAMDSLQIEDFSVIDAFDLTSLVNNIDVLLESSIFHFTLSVQLCDVLNDLGINVTSTYIDGTEIRITAGVDEYILKQEIKDLLTALNNLGVSDITTIDTSFYISQQEELDSVLNSIIMHQILSELIVDIASEIGIQIPTIDNQGYPLLIQQSQISFISKTEIISLFNGLEILGYEDINMLSIPLDCMQLQASEIDSILSSVLINVILSNQILDSHSLNSTIPDEIMTSIGLISKQELKAFILAYQALDYVSTETIVQIDDIKPLSLSDQTVILNSVIIRLILLNDFEQIATDNSLPLIASDYETPDQDYLTTAKCLELLEYYHL